VALARALVGQPDVLVLDEPTNHLDADTVEWLQGYLAGYRGAVLLVTHDRYLLEAVAERIVEIEDGRTVAYDGSYGDYLVARTGGRASRPEGTGAYSTVRVQFARRTASQLAKQAARAPGGSTPCHFASIGVRSRESVTDAG
jgi:ATP-binding cassette subfamily F protein uup